MLDFASDDGFGLGVFLDFWWPLLLARAIGNLNCQAAASDLESQSFFWILGLDAGLYENFGGNQSLDFFAKTPAPEHAIMKKALKFDVATIGL